MAHFLSHNVVNEECTIILQKKITAAVELLNHCIGNGAVLDTGRVLVRDPIDADFDIHYFCHEADFHSPKIWMNQISGADGHDNALGSIAASVSSALQFSLLPPFLEDDKKPDIKGQNETWFPMSGDLVIQACAQILSLGTSDLFCAITPLQLVKRLLGWRLEKRLGSRQK